MVHGIRERTQLLSLLTSAAVLVFSASAHAQATLPPASAFGEPPMFQGAELSPDGSKLAFFLNLKGQNVVATMNAPPATDPQLTMYPLGLTERSWRVNWASNDRLLFSTGQAVKRSFGDDDDTLHIETKLFSAPADLSAIVELNQEPKEAGRGRHPRPQFFSSITSMLPSDQTSVLQSLSWREFGVVDLYRTNVQTGEISLVEKGTPGTTGFSVDRSGEARLRFAMSFTSEKQSLEIRAPGGAWRDASNLVRSDPRAFIPQGFGADPQTLYVFSGREADTLGLYRFDLASQSFSDLVYRHPEVDLDGLIRDVETDDIIGVTYSTDTRQEHYFDARVQAASDDLKAKFAGAQVNTSSFSPGSSKFLARVSDPSTPPVLYLGDAETQRSIPVGPIFPKLQSVEFGAVVPVRYAARDGLEIPGYITLPPGVRDLSEASDLAFVVLPHGGPQSRDYQQFDWLSQFIATRGYGVLQMNFRGSAGFGAAFEEAGKGEWGGKMQLDVEDGARWLISQGYADPERLAIVGWSYGGYAALMGAIQSADLFACAASINGVTDLRAMRDTWAQFRGGRSYFRESFEGVDLDAVSPVRQAARVGVPVYLVQGGVDTRVPLEQGVGMREALEKAGVAHEWLPIPLGDHSLTRQPGRVAMLEGLETFLRAHIGPGRESGE